MTTKVRQSTLLSVANTQIVGTVASANTVSTPNFTVQESSGKIIIKYGSTTIFSIDSSGNVTANGTFAAGGTP
jgi:hypothetical protein